MGQCKITLYKAVPRRNETRTLPHLHNFPLCRPAVKQGSQGTEGWGSQPSSGTHSALHLDRSGNLPAGPGECAGFSRRRYRPKGRRVHKHCSETRPSDTPAGGRLGLTVSPLKRTDTRAGSDPLSSRRATSIAGDSSVTSRCHLQGPEPKEPARRGR